MVPATTPAPFPGQAEGRPSTLERPRLWATIALGARLAPRGAMVKIAVVIMAVTTLGALAAAIVLAQRGATASLGQLGAATSSALAWGAGILVAFPASLGALREDRASGVRALLRARGASTTTYARGRVLGLAAVLLVVVGGGTLVSGAAAMLLASRLGLAAHALQALVASMAYAVAFAVVVAPMSLAALGARSRGGGYVRFLVLLVLPELLEPWTSALVPAGWGDLLSVPSALAALRGSLLPPGIDAARLARALFALGTFAALCFVLVRAEIAALDAEPEETRS